MSIHPVGGGQFVDWAIVLVAVKVDDVKVEIKVEVGGNVFVAVTGIGEGIGVRVETSVSSGTNPTREIDSAPRVNPMERNAATSAFPNSRTLRINYFLFCFSASFSPEIGNSTLKVAP